MQPIIICKSGVKFWKINKYQDEEGHLRWKNSIRQGGEGWMSKHCPKHLEGGCGQIRMVAWGWGWREDPGPGQLGLFFCHTKGFSLNLMTQAVRTGARNNTTQLQELEGMEIMLLSSWREPHPHKGVHENPPLYFGTSLVFRGSSPVLTFLRYVRSHLHLSEMLFHPLKEGYLCLFHRIKVAIKWVCNAGESI